MKKYFLGLIVLAAPFLTGCVGGSGVITAESAPAIVQNITAFVNSSDFPKANNGGTETMPSDLKSNNIPSLSIMALPACYTVTGSSADTDADGIPVDETTTMNCSGESAGGNYKFTSEGYYNLKDLNDNLGGEGILGGYVFTYNIPHWESSDTSTGNKYWGSYIGSWKGSGTTDTANYVGSADGTFGSDATWSGKNYKLGYTYKYSYEVSYKDLGVSWATDSQMNGKGTYNVEGTFFNESHTSDSEVVSGSAQMTWEAKDLIFSSGCANVFKSGEWHFTDIGGNVLKVIYNCANYKTYLNGKLIDN